MKVNVYLWPFPGPWKGPWSLNFIHFTVNPPLSRGSFIETNLFIRVHQLIQLIRWQYFYNWLKHSHVFSGGSSSLCVSNNMVCILSLHNLV
jgi:hypothetical protein